MERKIIDDLEYIRSEGGGSRFLEKFWVRDDKLKLVKLSSDGNDQDIIEYLVSIILKRLGINAVDVELCHENLSGKDGCLVTNFLKDNEVLVDLVLPSVKIDLHALASNPIFDPSLGITLETIFQTVENYYSQYSPDLMRQYIRVLFGKCLTADQDSKMENIGLIKGDNYYRIPPSFDNGLSFFDYKGYSNSLICILKGYFDTDEVIAYIVNNYNDYVVDIVVNLEHFITNELDIIDAFDIDDRKKEYAKRYMTSKFNYIKELQNKKER